MLVRGRVEQNLRPVALEDLAHLRAVATVRQNGDRRREAAVVRELALDLEQRRLALVDEHTARTRDDHGLVLDVRGDETEVDLDLLAPEHVLDLNGADLTAEVQVACDQLVQARQRLDRHVLRATRLDDHLAHAARGGRNRDQHFVGPVVAQEMRKVVGRPEHAHPVDAVAALARIVVDEPDRCVVQLAVALHLAHHQLSCVAGADDQHLLAVRDETGRRPLDQRAREQA